MSFLSQLPQMPLAPADSSPFPFVPELTPERRTALLACSERYPIFQLLGMRLEDVNTDFARITLTHRLELTNPAGGLHGGIIATMLDTAVGFAIISTLKEGFSLPTISMDVKFHRPLLAGLAIAEGRLERKGRTILFADARLMSAEGDTLATGTCVYMSVPMAQLNQKS
jgi:uncharacterized protein (TIGR00369 family)